MLYTGKIKNLLNNLKDNLYFIGQYMFVTVILLLVFISVSMLCMFVYWDFAINKVLDEYFAEAQKEGYVTEDIKNGIMNEMDDIFGLLFDYEISGTDQKVKGGEMVYLKLLLYPTNSKFRNLHVAFIRNGRCKRIQPSNYSLVTGGN